MSVGRRVVLHSEACEAVRIVVSVCEADDVIAVMILFRFCLCCTRLLTFKRAGGEAVSRWGGREWGPSAGRYKQVRKGGRKQYTSLISYWSRVRITNFRHWTRIPEQQKY